MARKEFIVGVKNGYIASVHTMTEKNMINDENGLENPMLFVWKRDIVKKLGRRKHVYTAIACCSTTPTKLSKYALDERLWFKFSNNVFYFDEMSESTKNLLAETIGVKPTDFWEL